MLSIWKINLQLHYRYLRQIVQFILNCKNLCFLRRSSLTYVYHKTCPHIHHHKYIQMDVGILHLHNQVNKYIGYILVQPIRSNTHKYSELCNFRFRYIRDRKWELCKIMLHLTNQACKQYFHFCHRCSDLRTEIRYVVNTY